MLCLIAAMTALGACAPGGDDKAKAPSEKQGAPSSPQTPKEPNGPNDSGRNTIPDTKKESAEYGSDCGEAEPRACHLFALSAEDLVKVRKEVLVNSNGPLENLNLSTEQIAQVRVARIINWIQLNYPNAQIRPDMISSNSFLKYFKSYKW